MYLSPEPSDPPQNVTATVISSTEVMVSWKEVPAIHQNGEITTYEIEHVPLEIYGEEITTNTSNGSVLMMVLTGLEEYVEYNISVRAYTSVGPGPYSDTITERIDADRKEELDMISKFKIKTLFYRAR